MVKKKIRKIKRVRVRPIHNSVRAVCASSEREVSVPANQLSASIKKLRKAGYQIVGVSYGRTAQKKIWFVPRGTIF